MQLVFEPDQSPSAITGIDGARLRVGERWIDTSFWVSARALQPWVPRSIDAITPEHLQELLAASPEVILLGTGNRPRLLPPALQAVVLQHRCGLECMSNDAAVRTFNVLLGDGRAVLAAFVIRESHS